MRFSFFCCRRPKRVSSFEMTTAFMTHLLGDKVKTLGLDDLLYFQTHVINELNLGAIQKAQLGYVRLFPGDEQGFLHLSTTYLHTYRDLILLKLTAHYLDLRDYLMNGILSYPATSLHLMRIDNDILSALQLSDADKAKINYQMIFGPAGFSLEDLCYAFGEHHKLFADLGTTLTP